MARAYEACLWLYPQTHREAYGALMQQLFRDQLRDALAGAGAWALPALCLRTIADTLASALDEHREALGIEGWRAEPQYAPEPWTAVGLAVLPGLLYLFVGSIRVYGWLFGRLPQPAMAVFLSPGVAVLIILHALASARTLTAWSLLPVGILFIQGPQAIAYLTRPLLEARVASLAANLVAYGLAAAGSWVFFSRMGELRLPRWSRIPLVALALLTGGLVTVESLAGDGAFWRMAAITVLPWLALLAAMLIPLLGGSLAGPRHGSRGILLVLPLLQALVVCGVLDLGYGLAASGAPLSGRIGVELLPSVALLVVGPICVLRARSAVGHAASMAGVSWLGLLTSQSLRRTYTSHLGPMDAAWRWQVASELSFVLLLALAVAAYDGLGRLAGEEWVL
ncbi:MAG: hypothetical protein FJZ90_15435 [Chloroflexi bacterium]|nr:hypothetical protein [Chloroflexota bacterium]